MPGINLKTLKAYRDNTFHLLPGNRAFHSLRSAGLCQRTRLCFLLAHIRHRPALPLEGGCRESLGVPDNHDDPGHVTWGWKDAALPKKIWYYAKILRRKATMISLDIAPYFYALSENYGSPEEDYLLAYEEGRLTQAAKQIYETLLDKGSLDTISLRKEARLLNAKESAFNRAMEDLQMDFKILPVGVAEVGSWKYAFRYDITSRHMPELEQQARPIGEAEARQKLVGLYFASDRRCPAS